MMVRWIAVYASVLFGALATGFAWAEDAVELAQKPPVSAAPNWITKVDAEAADPKNTQLETLLVDRQLRVEPNGSSDYTHFVMHLGSQSAVDDESHVQITYRPSMERITLHSLTLRRGDRVIDQLKRASISTLRRELDLEEGIIDGDLTTSIVLEDVRVGDVLEYSYTRTTSDDGLGTPFADSFTTQWSEPVRHSYFRVLHPSARKINVRSTKPSEQPTVRLDGAWRELVWQWHGLSGIPDEGNRPGWYVYYPYIELSEAQSWQAIAHWAQRLYPSVPLTGELRSLVEQWQASGATKEARIMQALRFVQDEIRYTGIEIGPGGYQPQPPDVVLKRRFGDCKEKSYLLATLLKGLGVDARPALVSTYRKQAARDRLPSAGAFNHMIVRVQHAGKVHWLDPTHALQGGTLDSIQQAHFGAGLVIDDEGKFETMPPATLDAPDTVIVERFDLTAGVFEKAKMAVESTYLGAEADRMRSYFAATSKDETTRDYLNYYKDQFPTISVSAPFVVKDDRQANKLVVTESYALDPAFTKDEGDKQNYFEFDAHVVRSAAHAPKTIVRTSPLDLDHPTYVRYHAVVKLPEPWSIKHVDKTIAGPGFTYKSSVRYKGNTLTADYAFKTLVDDIPAAAVQEHARKLEAVRQDAYYYLSYDTDATAAAEPEPFELSLTMLFAVLGGVLGGGLLIRWLHRYENPRFPGPPTPDSPSGIGGWLILPALGTVITPVIIGSVIYIWRVYFDAGVWTNLGAGQDPVLAHWGKIALFACIVVGYALFITAAFLNYLLFTKRRSFPPGYIAILCIGALWGILVQVSNGALGVSNHYIDFAIVRDVVGAVLWTFYMIRSERVRATFIRTRVAPTPTVQLDEPVSVPAQ